MWHHVPFQNISFHFFENSLNELGAINDCPRISWLGNSMVDSCGSLWVGLHLMYIVNCRILLCSLPGDSEGQVHPDCRVIHLCIGNMYLNVWRSCRNSKFRLHQWHRFQHCTIDIPPLETKMFKSISERFWHHISRIFWVLSLSLISQERPFDCLALLHSLNVLGFETVSKNA